MKSSKQKRNIEFKDFSPRWATFYVLVTIMASLLVTIKISQIALSLDPNALKQVNIVLLITSLVATPVVLFAHEIVHVLFLKCFGANPRVKVQKLYNVFPMFVTTDAQKEFSSVQIGIILTAPLLAISGVILMMAYIIPTYGMALSIAFTANAIGSIWDLFALKRISVLSALFTKGRIRMIDTGFVYFD